MPEHIPDINSRSGKIFYTRIAMMVVGVLILMYIWKDNPDKHFKEELAVVLAAVCAHALIKEGIPFLFPCKNLELHEE